MKTQTAQSIPSAAAVCYAEMRAQEQDSRIARKLGIPQWAVTQARWTDITSYEHMCADYCMTLERDEDRRAHSGDRRRPDRRPANGGIAAAGARPLLMLAALCIVMTLLAIALGAALYFGR